MTAVATLILSLVPLAPSAECYARYDDEWCDAHAAQLAAAKPVHTNLTTDHVGGYRPGDAVPISGPRSHATIGAEDVPMLRAIVRWIEGGWHRWAVETIAGESEWNQHADNPTSSAVGYFQILCSNWCDGGDPLDPGWQARKAQWLLDHGGPGHWQYQP